MLPIVRPRRRSIRAAAPLLPLLLCALAVAAACGGEVRPAHAGQVQKASPTQVAEALEDFRRTAVVYRLEYDFNDKPLTGADPERLEFYPFSNTWPRIVSTPVERDASRFVHVAPDGRGYREKDEKRTGYVFAGPLRSGLTPVTPQTLLLLGGVAKDGGVITENYVNLYVRGDMAGVLTLQSYSTTVVRRGGISGRVFLGSYANLLVDGPFVGRLTTSSSCSLYLLGGIGTGAQVRTDRGARIYVGGRTPEEALSRIKGEAMVFLESSDLAPGKHQKGQLQVTVLGGDGKNCVAETGKTAAAVTMAAHRRPFPQGEVAQDVADVPMEDLRAGGDPDMRYALIGPAKKETAPPAAGYKLLLVLPGGDGSPDFNPFVRRIAKFALGPEYLVAHVVAPQWEAQSNRITWPTATAPAAGMRFPAEQFIAAVVADVQKRRKIDARHVYALGWSSGGPPVYAAALSERTPLTGAFIAMSIFRPADLPPLAAAKGRAFYLLHSPQDFIKIAEAERARDELAGAGARTTLTTYAGGHGWREDPYGHLARGIAWLEKGAAAAAPPTGQ